MRHALSTATLLLATHTGASAQTPTTPSAVLAPVLQCRNIPVADQRLACFEREVSALEQAEARREVMIANREQMRQTRRTLFGLPIPDISLFGAADANEEGVGKIESTIARLQQTPYGKWIIQLEDGARWEQLDSRELAIDPRPGHKIEIRRAAAGSYLANINGQLAIRVRRIR